MFGNRSLGLAHARGPALAAASPGTITAGLELALMPPVSDETATPTACRPGKGPENVNAVPGIGRVRATIVLPGRLMLDASWLPPVKVNGMSGSVVGLALRHGHSLTNTLSLEARAHATFGSVSGSMTCDEERIEDPTSICFDGTLSDDTFEPNIFGGDVTVARRTEGSQFSWYGGAGYSRLAPRFQVHFTDAASVLDTTKVEVDLHRVALFAGVVRSLSARWMASAEVYATTADGATVRVMLDRVVRRRQ